MIHSSTTAAPLIALLAMTATAQTSFKSAPASQVIKPSAQQTGSFFGGGDDCAAPDVIAGSGTFSYDTTAATTGSEGQNESNCYKFGTSGLDTDVWYEWTADFSGTALMTLCTGGVPDPKIAAYPGGGCPTDGSSLACNDDTCGLLSEITFPVTSGSSYMLQVGTFPGGTAGAGSFDLGMAGAGPPNDDCSMPTVISGQGSFGYNTTLATTGVEGQNESNCYEFGTTGIGSDIWYSWTADLTGIALMTMCNTGAPDTKIAAWPGGGCPVDGSSLACNDDTCGLLSEVSFPVVAGNDYLLQVGTFPGGATSFGAFDMEISPPPPLGTNYCVAAANSVSASGSRMSGSGSPSISAADLSLSADNAPTQPAIFYFGPNQVSITFGNGTRCVAGTVVSLPPINGSGGSFDYTIDFGLPQLNFVPGSTNFQCWYRDPSAGGAFFNLSDGFEIIMTP